MEKINIAELLKDCPSGMELDCTMYEDCKFLDVGEDSSNSYLIRITTPCGIRYLDKYGRYTNDDKAKCVIFPKGKTTWEGFVPPCKFKDGDVVTCGSNDNFVAFIYKERINPTLVKSHFTLYVQDMGFCKNNCISLKEDEIVFATEEEKEKLFKAIEEYGYQWDAENKCLDKLSKFNVGDKVKSKITQCKYTIVDIQKDVYIMNYETDKFSYHVPFYTEDNYELIEQIESKEEVDDRIVMSGIYFDRENYADEVELHLGNYEIETRDGKTYAVFKNQEAKLLKPKFKIGDRIKHKILNFTHRIIDIQDEYYIINEISLPHGLLPIEEQDHYELDKFDITTLKPFAEVLVRLTNNCVWIPKFFSHYDTNLKMRCYPFITTDNIGYVQCIPYKGNEHLCRTTNDCDDFYKIWT